MSGCKTFKIVIGLFDFFELFYLFNISQSGFTMKVFDFILH